MTDDIYLLLGTNLGNRAANLELATKEIKRTIGKISKLSRIYETAAWGIIDQPSFYNQVVALKTRLSPAELLEKLHAIELAMGRVRFKKWGERVIDIDILYFGDLQLDTPALTIPHPEIPNRRFTLTPLVEIAAEFRHPVLQQTNHALLKSCLDQLAVKPISNHGLPGNRV